MKIPTLLLFMVSLVVSTVSADDAKPPADVAHYSGNGIAFDYPKSWKLKDHKIGGIANVFVQNDQGTQVILQVHPADSDPKKTGKLLEDSMRKAFEGKLVPGSEKAAKRKIAGVEREGLGMDFEVLKDIAIHFEFASFRIDDKKPVVCMVFQNSAFDADAAKKGFDLISGSLAEAK
jgi:hypothetical protein